MSLITDDSTISLITAPPGSGKTLRIVTLIRDLLRAGEQVYVCNVNGLITDGEFAGWHPFDDPRRWMELPSGSVLIVDEAQEFFRPDGSRHLAEYYTEMERIRHSGVRLVIATQHHTFIHSHIQKLATKHEHLVRENGLESCTVYRRTSLISNTASDRALAKEDHERWVWETALYRAYKSAQVHKVKKTLKSKYKRGLILGGLAALAIGYAFYNGDSILGRKGDTDSAAVPAVKAGIAAERSKPEDGPKWLTLNEYAEAHLPRFATMPWTAPIFDERGITADPQIICMSSSPGQLADGSHADFSCTCLTEQGTLYDIGVPECRMIARRGPTYNPYKASVQQQQQAPPAYHDSPVAVSSRQGVAIPKAGL